MRAPLIILAAAATLGVSQARAGALAEAVRAGELRRAETIALKGPGLDGADALAFCRLALLENRAASARDCFAAILRRRPDDADALRGEGFAAWRLDDFETAATAFERAGAPARAAEARALVGIGAYAIRTHRPRYEVPFVRTDPLPLLKARLGDDKERLFILDTGAAETILDPPLAAALGLKPLKAETTGVFAGGKTAPVRFAVLPEIALGNLVLGPTPVMLQTTAPYGAIYGGLKVEGVIGVDLLRRFTATIDYPKDRLVLRPAAGAAGAAAGASMWMADDHLILAEAEIDGSAQLALIDTGLAGAGCTLPASTLRAIGQTADGPLSTGPGGGGEISARAFEAKSMRLGDAFASGTPCLYGPFPPSLETAAGTRIGLLLSHAFLRPYAVTFDFAAMRLSLRR